jgi:hypothetical protein
LNYLLKLQSVERSDRPWTVEAAVWADALMTRMLAQRNRLDIGGTTDPGH